MELDMDDLDPAEVARVANRLGTTEDAGLAALMGDAGWQRLQELSAAADIPIANYAAYEPWFAALAVEQLLMQREGFEAALGVEAHFVARAAADGKPIAGLETVAGQLGILDALPLATQRELLLELVAESDAFPGRIGRLLAAWRRGDTAGLEASLLEDLEQRPKLYDALVRRRNRAWLGEIEALLDDDDDYLVVVGTLHLVGDDGLPALLAARGFPVEQVTRSGR